MRKRRSSVTGAASKSTSTSSASSSASAPRSLGEMAAIRRAGHPDEAAGAMPGPPRGVGGTSIGRRGAARPDLREQRLAFALVKVSEALDRRWFPRLGRRRAVVCRQGDFLPPRRRWAAVRGWDPSGGAARLAEHLMCPLFGLPKKYFGNDDAHLSLTGRHSRTISGVAIAW